LNKDTSLQKADKITEQDQKLPMEEEKHPWILVSSKTTITKMGNLDALTATSIDI